MATLYAGRLLDQVTRHDVRSLDHLVAAKLPGRVQPRTKLWTPGRQLDQGEEGACTAFGTAADMLAVPVPVTAVRGVPVDDAFAFAGYQRIKRIDEFPGEDYEGSSVNAAMKWYRELGLISGWWWCKTPAEMIQALIQLGPVVIGTPWWDSMYETSADGLITVSGTVVGGHCILANGYIRGCRVHGGAECVRLRNSWGVGWGDPTGHGHLPLDEFSELVFTGNGEVAVAVGRRQADYALAAGGR
jgi:hypothetical protein